ncbi:MAG: non-ribosomal peptide synthetase module [Vallitaleaceae bacterium]|nr:non-ribosomal peptide synthetase module [Vallitaleaceae bacterium]
MKDVSVSKAFRIYAKLQANGKLHRSEARQYESNDEVRNLVGEFAKEVDCGILLDESYLYMIPLTVKSEYQISNERIKKDYLPSRSLNSDIYLMYFAIIVFAGEFYDSFQRNRPTRDFLSGKDWIERIDERLQQIKSIGEKELLEKEDQYEYHWIELIKNWDAMDSIREGIKRQTARSVSRMSFIHIVAEFMKEQELIRIIGEQEYALTEKFRGIIENYYMDYEYNRGVLEFIYQFERGDEHAGHIENTTV